MMTRLVVCVSVCLFGGIGAAGDGFTVNANQNSGVMQQLTFAASQANFPNPERGFFQHLNPIWPLGAARRPLTLPDIGRLRSEGITLIHAYYVIDEFRDAPISAAALDDFASDFTMARQAGVKVIPRFTYNFPCAGSSEPCGVTGDNAPDAPLERILGHLDQLAPVLRANRDVLAFMEMGFVGPWGEWHDSSNGLLNPDDTANESSRAIIERELWALPDTRMAVLRYPIVKQQLFGPTPLPPDEAFTRTARSRLGFHNDCFLASSSSGNTYRNPTGPTTPAYVESQKALVNQETRFVPQGGEACSSAPSAQPYIQCPNALRDFALERWSTINGNNPPEVLNLWRQQGCFDEIQKRLGYRFRLVSAEVPSDVRVGDPLSMSFTIVNDGIAAPYNPRVALIVLRHAQTGRVWVMPVTEDPRRWGAGETHTVTVGTVLPTDAESGAYQVLLNFPDPEPALYSRPEYAIRLANDGLWEETTGSNVLPARIMISR